MVGFSINNVERSDSAVAFVVIAELRIFRPEKEELGNTWKKKIT
jgi:hypothetical protein